MELLKIAWRDVRPTNHLQNKQYYGIDIMKFVMSVFVVAIHRSVFSGGTSPALNMIATATLARPAVPYFFAAAAFLFFGKALTGERTPGKKVPFKYVSHILLVYVIWSVLYCPVYLSDSYAAGGTSAAEALREYAVRFLFYGAYLHLWFLPALAFLTALTWLLLKKIPAAVVAGVSLAAVLVCRAALWAGGKDGGELPYYIDSAFFYLIFTAMGAHIAQHEGLSRKADVIGLAGTFVLLLGSNIFAERYAFGPLLGLNMLAKDYDVGQMPVYKNIFLIPFIYFLFTTMKNIRFKERKFYSLLRPATTLIYLTHLLVPLAALAYTSRLLGVENPAYTGPVCFALTLAFTLPLSFGLAWLEKRRHFRWLKMLH